MNNRLLKDLQSLLSLSEHSGYAEQQIIKDTNISVTLKISFGGPEKSPFVNKLLTLHVTFSYSAYPFEPPLVKFMHPVPYHPNISADGDICLELLKKPPQGTWRPTISIIHLLHSITLLLVDPNPDDPLRSEVAAELRKNPELYRQKAASSHTIMTEEITSRPSPHQSLDPQKSLSLRCQKISKSTLEIPTAPIQIDYFEKMETSSRENNCLALLDHDISENSTNQKSLITPLNNDSDDDFVYLPKKQQK